MQYGVSQSLSRSSTLHNFEGKVWIVTGAASGLGQRSAIMLAREGARLVLFDRDAASLAATQTLCRGALSVVGNVTRHADVMRAVDAAAEVGPIRLLATAAGILGPAKPLTEIDEADWDQLFDINVKVTWLALRAAGGGAVVCFSSAAGLTGSETMPAYSASKGAVVMLTRSAARSEAQYGIRVNCVCPGSIETPMLEATFAAAETPALRADRETASKARHPLGRFDDGTNAEPLPVRATVTVSGDRIAVDFAGTAAQVGCNLDAPLASTMSATLSAVKAALTDPDVPFNAGAFRPIDISAPLGSLLNPRHPAPVRARMEACYWVWNVVMKALAQAVPGRVASTGFYTTTVSVLSQLKPGGWSVYLEIYGGGLGARSTPTAATA